ncbi:LysR family transcriptional regulator [Iodobacter ciconiae]|uniref:LysR family transcriptional regulator n=1 Tax=Iodobacter ciconiae TaxID=2496266 RepID=A0A3S8ZST3_9NEIS|nr:LysR family transcriptional regulator [Iodobacter ciconiae]AZN36573.1 LysR family transcriptional regulator [Iodobacter ciconiae]
MQNWINPLWIRSFLAVNQQGSFTRAADSLNITQAAVSQHLQRLESQLGTLLIRRPRQIELTPAGKILLEYANEIETAHTRLHNNLSNHNPYCGEISIATPGSVGLALYPQLLTLQQQHLQLTVTHRIAPTDDIIAAVLTRRCELGIVARSVSDERLCSSKLTQEALCLVLPMSWAGEKWEELCELGLINHPDGMDMASRLFARTHPGQRVSQLPVRGFSNQISLILEPVARGLGFTVLPRFAVNAFNKPEQIRIANNEIQVNDTLWLIHRAEWPVSAAGLYVLEEISAYLKSNNN